MPRAEVGSIKHLSNQMKSKGLTRLRWYCQICERATRDENAFKMHCQSESHTRRALEVGRDFKGAQEGFSREFERNFVQLLRTAHGEKEIHANRFYQEVIADKTHVHLNATKWHSLTEFVKHLGRSGIVRAEEKEDGIFIAYIDSSPETLARRESARKKELQDKGDEEREQAMLREQIKRAQRDAEARGISLEEMEEEEQKARELHREEGEKIKLSFGSAKAASAKETTTSSKASESPPVEGSPNEVEAAKGDKPASGSSSESPANAESSEKGDAKPDGAATTKPVSLKFGAKPQPKNVFKNAFAGSSKKVMAALPKKMSEAERIMKEEIERKRAREAGGGPPNKKMRFQI
ncbi:domain of Kin17 curved DNA-binding protein-domain-containing protein [Echria macrotheca]|uniref:Domain of Kin17 curved DNA-binding protein-domain-containing protein n=1 Tax=Echria macrotheca TaxID=438768 RepID=A0AAJ0BMD6_9PEZI|nr:domain of Kin17 curved DNA-binding protein-domain-containing protein [Echria macrotheca]